MSPSWQRDPYASRKYVKHQPRWLKLPHPPRLASDARRLFLFFLTLIQMALMYYAGWGMRGALQDCHPKPAEQHVE